MSHPIRKWLKDTLQYGRRTVQTPGDSKPPLLWLADLPRLGDMWIRHLWFRMWFDLRGMPPRVYFAPREVNSPYVHFVRPTRINPIQPLIGFRESLEQLDRWLSEGGLARLLRELGNGIFGTVFGLVGGLAIGIGTLLGTFFTFLSGLFGASALGAVLGLNSLGEGVRNGARRLGAGTAAFVTDFENEATRLYENLRSPKEVAWLFATTTGIIGLILLLLIPQSEQQVEKQAVASELEHTAHRPEETFKPEPPEYAALPDPFAPTEPTVPELALTLERAALPPTIARYNLPDSEEMFEVVAEPTAMIDVASLPDDEWLTALPTQVTTSAPVVPAAYSASAPAVELSPPPEPMPTADGFSPGSRGIGIVIQKSQPKQARVGELIWYDLTVTNQSGEGLRHVEVQERVAPPHRVADAVPPARFHDGVLIWQLEEMTDGESRTIRVGIYPMSTDPVLTEATIRPISTLSVATYVKESTPEPEADPSQYRRIKIVMTTPKLLENGGMCGIRIAVTNTGTVPLTGIGLRGVVPTELKHRHGMHLEKNIGALAPGESRETHLQLKGVQLGFPNVMTEVITAEGIGTAVSGTFEVVERLYATR